MKVFRIKDDGLIATSKAIQTKLKGTGTLVYKNGTGFADYIKEIKTPADNSIPTYAGSNIITPSRAGETLQTKGQYLDTNLNIMGDLDLKPTNIRKGINIFNVIGELEEGIPVPLANCTSISAENLDGNRAILKWTDPQDSIYNQDSDQYNLSTWAKTTVTMKENTYPTSPSDGRVVLDSTVRNQYSSKYLIIENLTAETNYNIKLFPTNDKGLVTNKAQNQVAFRTKFIQIGASNNISCSNPKTGTTLELKWTDPQDVTRIIDGVSYTTAQWKQTIVLVREDRYPENLQDGRVVVRSMTRNQYQNSPYTVTGLVDGTKYYFSLFTVATNGVVNADPSQRVECTAVSIIPRRYGVKFNGSSTTGTRLFDAVGKNVQIASSVSQVVPNDFDTDEWFKDITYPIVDGNYVTRFKMCYGKIDFANQEFIFANDSFDGLYDVLPFFKAPDGSILPYNDIGRFFLGPDYKSKPNVDWLASQTRSQFRSGVRGLGNQYSQWDIATITFIRVLFMIVLANRNSQQILPCNTSGSKRNTGDTLNAKSSIVQIGNTAGSFYGLENIVDGGYYFIDGVNCDASGGKWYVCNNPSKYADDTTNGYTVINKFGYPKASSSWITKMDIDPQAPYAGLVSQNSGGSDSTYYCDYHYRSTSGWRIMYTGGYWSLNGNEGLFYSDCAYVSGRADSAFGSRLVRRPF